MRTFLVKISIYLIALLAAHWIAAHYADGYTDSYYLRFATPAQENLILGTSRAAQGLRPEYMESAAYFNYAFTLLHSPYGPSYRESIIKKLRSSEGQGKFILTVDPWSISAKAQDPEDASLFKEAKTEMGRTECVTCTPNYEYLLDNYPKGWGKMILRRIKPNPSIHRLHGDGWLEITVPMDSLAQAKRVTRKMKEYERNTRFFAPSSVRSQALRTLISHLQNEGQVYLIRLPVPEAMVALEEEYMPEFNAQMLGLSEEMGLPYYDLTLLPDTFRYTDGNHLHKSSAKSLSRLVDSMIQRDASDR